MNNLKPNNLRNHILDMVYDKKSGHIGGSFSICELLSHLYSNYDCINHDKLILSKGHAVPALYAVLYEIGIIKDFSSFREIDSKLQGHPDKLRLPEVQTTTGSLGQGLSIAIGHALASKLNTKNNQVFCILGDGEMQEGQVWEALMLAPKYNLTNLVCFIDHNKGQGDGLVENILNLGNLPNRIRSFGWDVKEIDGHDIKSIQSVLEDTERNNPLCVVMHTIKGKGVSFMEGNNDWHSKVPTKDEYEQAKKELNEIN